jgi:hypothetical protein
MKKVWLLETTWNKDCPPEVKDAVRELWGDYLEYGNDHYYWSTSLDELKGLLEDCLKVQPILSYASKFVTDDEEDFLIHYWW